VSVPEHLKEDYIICVNNLEKQLLNIPFSNEEADSIF